MSFRKLQISYPLVPLGFSKEIEKYREKRKNAKIVLVSGTRGKSSIVKNLTKALYDRGYSVVGKITGTRPYILYGNGGVGLEKIEIDRSPLRYKVWLDAENIAVVNKFDADIYVLENQTITKYTNGFIHYLLRPDIEINANIRLDHLPLGESLEELAEHFASVCKLYSKDVCYAEPLREIADVVEPYFHVKQSKEGILGFLFKERVNQNYNFERLYTPEGLERIPGIERIYCVDWTLKKLDAGNLYEWEKKRMMDEIDSTLRPKKTKQGFYYVDLSKANDPLSAKLCLDYIMKRNEKNFNRIIGYAYFRPDRVDRTRLFRDMFFSDEETMSIFDEVILDGYYAKAVKKVLGERGTVLASYDYEGLQKIIDGLDENTLVITLVNGVNRKTDFLLSYMDDSAEQKYSGSKSVYY